MSENTGEERPKPLSPAERHRQRLSQVQGIARGSSVTVRRYGVRSQPSGPGRSSDEGNAARLSTVPSSSEEKYQGGRD